MANNALAVKTALKTAVDQIPALAKIQRTWSYPMREPERRWVLIGEITWQSSDWVTNRSREETFSISVLVNVQMTAATPEEVEKAVGAIAASIEDVLNQAPKIIPTVVTAGLRPKRLTSFPSTDAYEAQFEAEAVFTARF